MAETRNRPATPDRGRPTGAPARQGTRPAPGSQAARPARTSGARESFSAKRPVGMKVLAIVAVLAIAAGFLLQYKLFPDGIGLKVGGDSAQEAVAEIHSSSTVRLNEVMTSNASALLNEEGESCDWVELRNYSSEPVNLQGWSIAKVANSQNTFTFPNHVLEAGECLLLLADSTVSSDFSNGVFHLPFKLSASGDTLMLFNRNGTAVDTINIPALKRNQVYRLMDGNWETSSEYTPGMDNTQENYQSLISVSVTSDVKINEIMASNASYAQTEQGYFDYIELYNASAEEADLTSWYLSDNRDKTLKWRFPEGTVIPAGGYLLIYASGLDQGLHTNFRLSSEGEDVVLSNADGQPVEIVNYGLLKTDQAYSRMEDGSFTTSLAPTPGMANTTQSAALMERQFAAQNTSQGIFLNEIMASTREQPYDWVELVNRSDQAVDISGWGLSDDPGSPRQWQFPEGTVVQPGQYLGVSLAGFSGTSQDGILFADFKLSAEGGYAVTLSLEDGTIADRVPMPEQYADISYGRVSGSDGFYYMTESTPLAANASSGYTGRASEAVVTVPGGIQQEAVTVEISAPEDSKVYYTLDSSAPTEDSALYTGPIEISETTVLRTRVYVDGLLPSFIDTQTYFYGISHDMRVVSLVSDPADMFDETTGMYMAGPNAEAENPHKGANYWKDWEREGHIEMFLEDGTTMLSQGCGVKLHGQYSRAESQKAFKIIARREYSGEDRFEAPIFSRRDYTEYQSFLLRGSGQDGTLSRMRDSVLSTLAENTSVMYMETELCVVYINGQYWGHYNIRERINTYSICQFEGWEGQEDDINLVKANTNVMQGSDDTYQQMLSYVKQNGIPDDTTLEAVGQVVDLQNYIEYHLLEIFVGNGDTANVKRYMNPNADGKWRYCLFDLDWAFFNDTDSIGRWLTPGGMGTNKGTDNTLFIALMKNATFRDRFLTVFGEKLAADWSTTTVTQKFTQRYNELLSEIPRHMERWPEWTQKTLNTQLSKLGAFAKERPAKIIAYTRDALDLSDADLEKYFGEAIRVIQDTA